MVAFISLIIGALLDLLRPDGQSTSILTIGPSLTDISKANRYRGTDIWRGLAPLLDGYDWTRNSSTWSRANESVEGRYRRIVGVRRRVGGVKRVTFRRGVGRRQLVGLGRVFGRRTTPPPRGRRKFFDGRLGLDGTRGQFQLALVLQMPG